MARAGTSQNDQALAAFLAAKIEIDSILDQLTTLSAAHFETEPERITWGNVGSANHIRDGLRDLACFATGEP